MSATPALKRLLVLVMACVIFFPGQAWPSPTPASEGQPPLIVRELAVQGNRRVQEAVILGRVQTKIGAPFTSARVAEDIRTIFALGFFEDVQVKVDEFEGGIKLTFVVVERPFVRDVEFHGNRSISTSPLREKVDLKLGTIYNPVEVQRAREKLSDHYEQEGYFEAQVVPETERLPDGDVKVVFVVTEGRRFTVHRIVIEGARGLSERQVKALMKTQERRFLLFGGILRRQTLEEDIERIVALYHDHGYIQARVEGRAISVDQSRARVTITIRLAEGPQFTVGRMDITGTNVLPAEEVRRQISLAPGEAFSRSKLLESLRGIRDLYSAIGRACAEVHVTLEIAEGSQVVVERIKSPTRC